MLTHRPSSPCPDERLQMPFSPSVRRMVLLWCDRHCCLCKRACGLDMEVDHLVPSATGGSDDADNALPLCFECHARAHRYNDKHPRGTEYFYQELRARRDQDYEQFTRYLAPPSAPILICRSASSAEPMRHHSGWCSFVARPRHRQRPGNCSRPCSFATIWNSPDASRW